MKGKNMATENKKSSAVIPSEEGCPKGGVGSCDPNPKNIIVRNAKLGLVRRARKSELKWFADRGFVPLDESQTPKMNSSVKRAAENV